MCVISRIPLPKSHIHCPPPPLPLQNSSQSFLKDCLPAYNLQVGPNKIFHFFLRWLLINFFVYTGKSQVTIIPAWNLNHHGKPEAGRQEAWSWGWKVSDRKMLPRFSLARRFYLRFWEKQGKGENIWEKKKKFKWSKWTVSIKGQPTTCLVAKPSHCLFRK